MNELPNQPRNQNPEFLPTGIPVDIENGDKETRLAATEKLEKILKAGVKPEVADAIRQQLVALQAIAIEKGEEPIVPKGIGLQAAITVDALKSDKNFSAESLAKFLNGDTKFIDASQIGAGYNEARMLIEEEERKARNN